MPYAVCLLAGEHCLCNKNNKNFEASERLLDSKVLNWRKFNGFAFKKELIAFDSGVSSEENPVYELILEKSWFLGSLLIQISLSFTQWHIPSIEFKKGNCKPVLVTTLCSFKL